MSYSNDCYYTRKHEWIKVDGSIGTVGITDLGQSQLGELVYVELPKVGSTLRAGRTFGSLESVNKVSDLYSPVTGIVTEVNMTLGSSPQQINTNANQTWILRVRLSNSEELSSLMTIDQYLSLFNINTHDSDRHDSKRETDSRPGTDEANSQSGATMSSERARQLLGLGNVYSNEELKSAWRQKVLEWHPDKLDGMAEELKQIATKKVQLLNEAYALLKDKH